MWHFLLILQVNSVEHFIVRSGPLLDFLAHVSCFSEVAWIKQLDLTFFFLFSVMTACDWTITRSTREWHHGLLVLPSGT